VGRSSAFRDSDFGELRDLSEATATVAGACAAGVFSGLASEGATPDELATRLELSARAMEILLPFLEELGLVTAEEGRFELTERARRELADPSDPAYCAGGLPLWLGNLEAWTRLPQALASGNPVRKGGADAGGDDPESQREGIARFMAGMAAAPRERVQRLVEGVMARCPEASTLLDVGGGPGHMSRAFIERGLTATLLDRPQVVQFVDEEYELAQADGLTTVGGDFLEDPLPQGPFDVVLLSNVLHMLSPDQARVLVSKAGEVTRPGGVVAVADFIRGLSPRATRFALVMLLRSEGGNTYTLEEHERWFQDGGFAGVEVRDLDPDRQLVTAIRQGG
jgi:SAM-dependent methyltransferase/DNA-binding transcriptional ArsR family regulator